MSWLSSLFGGGGEDPEAVRQRQAAADAAARASAQQVSDRQMQMQLDYLNQLRADEQTKDAALAAKDPTATRQAARTSLSNYFVPEFESSFVPGTITDPYETAAYNTQRGSADEFLDRLFKRGVITESGKAAGTKELDRQGAGVRQQLQSISDSILGGERAKLGDIANRGFERAGSLNVGEGFDISPYSTAAQNELGTFTSGLSDAYNSMVPTDLFDTSVLGNIAGSAQFAGNRPFDPDITPGAPKEDDTDPFTGQKLVQKRTSTVF